MLIWNQETKPAAWSKGLVIKIPKKGDRSVRDNYRGITLLSVLSKIFCRVVIKESKTLWRKNRVRNMLGLGGEGAQQNNYITQKHLKTVY